jgi:hypothetical protein
MLKDKSKKYTPAEKANTMFTGNFKKTKKRQVPGTVNYCDKETMLAELVKYHKSGVISEDLGRMFMQIAEKLANNWRFFKYTDKADMISACVERMIQKIDKYDINHPQRNPFWYFSQLAYYQIIGEIKQLNKGIALKSAITHAYTQELVHSTKIRAHKHHIDDDHDKSDNILHSIEEHQKQASDSEAQN